MPPMTRVAGYVRTSAVEEGPDLSAEAQRARLERDIAGRGWQLSHVYEDVGPAALAWRLPGLQEALEAAPDLDRLVVVTFDRVAASVQRAIRVLARLQDAGCELVCLDQADRHGRGLRADAAGLAGEPGPGRTLLQAFPGPAGGRRGASAAIKLSPPRVIDVGAGAGTPALYEAFPDAHHVLIEPLVEFETALQALVERAAPSTSRPPWSRAGEMTLNVTSDLYSTSALRRTAARPLKASRARCRSPLWTRYCWSGSGRRPSASRSTSRATSTW